MSMILKFTIDGEEFELKMKKGNAKPIPKNVWISSMQSSYYCICGYLGLCPFHRLESGDCYGLAYEMNEMMGPKTIIRRRSDEKCIDELVKNKMHKEFAEELLRRNKLARKHKMQFERWNETGDMKTLDHFIFVDMVSDILFKEAGITTTIYTHRKDLWEKFKEIRVSEGLIVMGSGFMADMNFKALTDNDKECDLECSSNCEQCFEDFGIGHCYDLKNKGKNLIVGEDYRENKKVE